MSRLFSCLRRSPHLQLTFTARFYTQQEMLRHTHTHTLLTLILSAPKGKAVTQARLATTTTKKKNPTDVH